MHVYKIIDNKIKQLQSIVFDDLNIEKCDKYNIISELFDTRLNIFNKSKITSLIDNVKNKIQSFFMLYNNIKIIPNSIYMFIGHGWNTSLTFDISKLNNFHVIILKEQSCLQETTEIGQFNPFDLAFTTKNNPNSILYSFIDINKKAKLYGNNNYIHYDSEKNSTVPNMILSLQHKQNERNFFIQIANSRTELNKKTMLLSELVNAIASENNNNVILQIMTCRANITNFQIENIPIVFPNNKKMLKLKTSSMFARKNKQLIVNDDEEIGGGDEIIQKIVKTKIKNEQFKIVKEGSKIPDPPSELFFI